MAVTCAKILIFFFLFVIPLCWIVFLVSCLKYVASPFFMLPHFVIVLKVQDVDNFLFLFLPFSFSLSCSSSAAQSFFLMLGDFILFSVLHQRQIFSSFNSLHPFVFAFLLPPIARTSGHISFREGREFDKQEMSLFFRLSFQAVRYAKSLIEFGLKAQDIGIITPYRKQVREGQRGGRPGLVVVGPCSFCFLL